jgi:hypothetical protein
VGRSSGRHFATSSAKSVVTSVSHHAGAPNNAIG